MPDLKLTEISEKMRDIDFAILSTRTEGGAVAGRPMSNNRQVEYDGDRFFFTCDDARTVIDIRHGSTPSRDETPSMIATRPRMTPSRSSRSTTRMSA